LIRITEKLSVASQKPIAQRRAVGAHCENRERSVSQRRQIIYRSIFDR